MRCANIFAAIILFVFLATSASAEVIRIVPGPLDGCKIITPWGDYVAVQHGSTIWVGTEQQYENARVRSILEQDGMREVKLEGISGPNTHAIVSRKLPTAAVGKVQLYDISGSILFGMGPDKKLHRPAKPVGFEFVSVSWVQSEKASITTRIYDLDAKKSYSPYTIELHNGIHLSEFSMPRSALTHKVGLVFTFKKSKPGYIQFDSIAQQHYKNIKDSVEDNLRHKIPIYDNLVTDLGMLHQLDPSIPAELDPSIQIEHEVDYDKMPNKGCPMVPDAKGKKVTDRQMEEIYSGMTVDEIVRHFGRPAHCSSESNGSTIFWWRRGGKKGGEQTITFDSQGKVTFMGNVIED
jgi:hypothetical protein